MKKITTGLILVLLVINSLMIPVFAQTMDISPITDPPTVDPGTKGTLNEIWNHMAPIISTIAVGIAAIMLIVVAIKYMAAAPGEKAQLKKHLVIYVVGAIFILCSVGIISLLKGVAETIF